MKKFLLFSLILFVAGFATELQYNTEFENLENGDSIDVDLHLHAPLDSVKNVINGNLTNTNFSDTAYFKQRSIDSTAQAATDWIFPYTRKWQVWDTATWTGRCGRGMYFYINDTTANDRDFRIYDDSSNLLLAVNDDSVAAGVPIKNDNIGVDTISDRAGNVNLLLSTDNFTSPLTKFGFGVASPINVFEIQKDQDAATTCSIKNGTSGGAASALFQIESNSCIGQLIAREASAGNEFADKIVLYAYTDAAALMLNAAGSSSPIEFYVGGSNAANKKMSLSTTKLDVDVDTLDVQGVVIADSIQTPGGWLSYIEDSFICTLSYNVDTIVIDTCFYTKVGNNVTLRFKEMISPADGAISACGIKVNAMPLSIFNDGTGEYMPCWANFNADCSGGAYFVDNAAFGGRAMLFKKYDNSAVSDDQSVGTPLGGTYLHYTKY